MSRLYFHILDESDLSRKIKKHWKEELSEKVRLYPVAEMKKIPINGNKDGKFCIYTEMDNPNIDLLPKIFGKIIKDKTNYLWGVLVHPKKKNNCMMFIVDIDNPITVSKEEVIFPRERRLHVFLKKVMSYELKQYGSGVKT